MPTRLPCSWLPALVLLSLASCDSQPPGSAQLAAVRQSLSSHEIAHVLVTVSAPDMAPRVVELARSSDSWGGLIGNLPAGSQRTFLAEAFDSSNVLRLQGEASGITLTANQTTAVAVTLQEVTPPPPFSNEAPLIDAVVASATSVQAGGALSLAAAAHDPNPDDTLTFAWTGSGGTFSAPAEASSSWSAPSSMGLYTLTLTVTDPQGAAVSTSLRVSVGAGPTGGAALDLSFNSWPVVSSVSASLHRLEVGQSTSLAVSASDADGDTLAYQWDASCAGSWMDASAPSGSFVPSSVPASACNNCRLTVTVKDGRGGQTTGSINLCVTSASAPERSPPVFTHSYQSATSASPGHTVVLEVSALDPQASSMTFAWSHNTGALAPPENTASTSRIAWTAPSCVVAGLAPSVTAVVTNAHGLSASLPFSIPGSPPCTPGWSSAGLMASAHYAHTATLLASGKVLVSGGYNGAVSLSSAELYDPATNSWSSAGAMASPRHNHTAILLASGKVLVSGGNNGSATHSSAELYDPATNSWSQAASMRSPRNDHGATLLASGQVLVSGGHNGSTMLASAEVYDPATDSWSPAGSMASPRRYHAATLLASGQVLVAGGYDGAASLSSAELYDPATSSWSSGRAMTAARRFPTATRLSSGQVLVSGGHNDSASLSSSELYDPATNSWSSAGAMAAARYIHSATLLPSGKVLVSGGFTGSGYLASAEVYDPAMSAWSPAGSMAAARRYHTATLLPSGQVLVTGGSNGSLYLSSAERYTP